ncbi:hypothetical protein OPIT5_01455 [Opitutaceae bacterium TAV5]|nr:hypothetical protein OPIT5_01455 [Opitutaceae bacterium TAV5]
MKSRPNVPIILAASGMLAFTLGLTAQTTTWTTVLHDSFSLNGTTRVAGGDPQGLAVEEGAGMVFWRRNGSTAFGPNGGIVGYDGANYGAGAPHLSIGYPTSPGVGPHFGQFTTGQLKLTASVTIGDLASQGWIGISFRGNPDAAWFPSDPGFSNNSNPLWIRIDADGWLTVDGTWLSWEGRQAGDPLPSVKVSDIVDSGFTTQTPVEIAVSYNLETYAVDVYFNGQSIMASYGLYTKNANGDPATMLIMNGAGLYIQGSTSGGVVPTVNTLTVEHGVTAVPEPGTVALIIGLLALPGAMLLRIRRRKNRA